MTSARRGPRRRDARRNREAILEAARELFAESGDAPMYEVARRAEVGQATLYRNFPERWDLAAALLDELVDAEERLAAEHAGDPDAFFVLVRSMVETAARFHALGTLGREHRVAGPEVERVRQRYRELIKGPIRDAKAAGTLRRDLTVDDVFLLLAMVSGALEGVQEPAARAAAASRALALALDGLGPTSGHVRLPTA